MIKIYLDIDGVLLTKKLAVPDYGVELISFLTSEFDCYWLTTHCRGGENKSIEQLAKHYDQETLIKLESIKPTDWEDLKTEGIDLKSDFIWLEDYPFESEKDFLSKHGKLESLLVVDLTRKNELINIEITIKNTAANFNS